MAVCGDRSSITIITEETMETDIITTMDIRITTHISTANGR